MNQIGESEESRVNHVEEKGENNVGEASEAENHVGTARNGENRDRETASATETVRKAILLGTKHCSI